MKNNKNSSEDLENKLDSVLNDKNCSGSDCVIQDPEEIVQRENKKIITNDGRQLLNEYTRR
tara:strand:+ start:584 stop:766 length:183 start_codon:yes stop_codon:yes gene_type:complete